MAKGDGVVAERAKPDALEIALRFFRSTPRRTFLLYPLLSFGAALLTRGRGVRVDVRFLPLLLWGYGQYRLVGAYLRRHGLGGPSPADPPKRLVTGGPYSLTRNPMYLGHLLFMLGLTLSLRSPVALALTLLHTCWFHTRRVREDEQLLRERYGDVYLEYTRRVKRWLPGLF